MKNDFTNKKNKATKILKSKRDFEKIFNSGRIIYSSNKKLKASYIATNSQDREGIYLGVTVNKKLGTGVWRNRIKRLLRESIRRADNILVEITEKSPLQINIVFSPNLLNQISNKKIGLDETLPDVTEILIKLKNQFS